MERSQGAAITCVVGVAGALGSHWLAARLFRVRTSHGLVSLFTWLAATGGATAPLADRQLISGRTGIPMAQR
jgi:uncharacterized membrane protein YeaQ/YmgE (transglycosylase-associated protein family)